MSGMDKELIVTYELTRFSESVSTNQTITSDHTVNANVTSNKNIISDTGKTVDKELDYNTEIHNTNRYLNGDDEVEHVVDKQIENEISGTHRDTIEEHASTESEIEGTHTVTGTHTQNFSYTRYNVLDVLTKNTIAIPFQRITANWPSFDYIKRYILEYEVEHGREMTDDINIAIVYMYEL